MRGGGIPHKGFSYAPNVVAVDRIDSMAKVKHISPLTD